MPVQAQVADDGAQPAGGSGFYSSLIRHKARILEIGIDTCLIALSFAEAGSMFDQAGGPYLYAREAFGGFVGFEIGWMFLIGRVAGAGAIANAFTAYLGWFWPPAAATASTQCTFAASPGNGQVRRI